MQCSCGGAVVASPRVGYTLHTCRGCGWTLNRCRCGGIRTVRVLEAGAPSPKEMRCDSCGQCAAVADKPDA